MEVKQEVLDKLRCSLCTCYLSCAPVLLASDGKSLCGRCPALEEAPAVRNQPYELLAQHVAFPCKYEEEGCQERLPFGQQKAHEDNCKYKRYICPVVEVGSCEWLGPRNQLLEHCRAEHPTQVVENHFKMSHDISSNNLHTYIMTAFNILFLVHAKVCLTTRKLYHSVRLIGNPEYAVHFNFTLSIEREEKVIMCKKPVAPEGCMFIKEHLSIQNGINNLLGILDGYQETIFTLSVEMKKTSKCAKCEGCVLKFMYRDTSGWLCEACMPEKKSCKNLSKGCTFTEYAEKIVKHSKWFCPHSNGSCCVCKQGPLPGYKSTHAHYVAVHSAHMNRAGTKWRHSLSGSPNWHILTSDVGTDYYILDVGVGALVYKCNLSASKMYVEVLSQLSSDKLHLYDCVLELTNPESGYSKCWNLDSCYLSMNDWSVNIKEGVQLFVVNNKVDISINIVNKS